MGYYLKKTIGIHPHSQPLNFKIKQMINNYLFNYVILTSKAYKNGQIWDILQIIDIFITVSKEPIIDIRYWNI